MERDIKAIILMLSSQAMINLGIIPDPVSKETILKLDKAEIFVELLNVLKLKTKNNLSNEEQNYIDDVYNNIVSVYKEKSNIKEA
jgi:ribosome assembly protein YihI (activator of Der GTPase)